MIANNSSLVSSNAQNQVAQISSQDVPTSPVTSSGAGYFSPFAQIRTLAELQTAGQIFASSDFAPKNFQGNVGNCMIALDVANRLGMNVLTLMQNLYIIDGKPSISTALAHSLFNMQFGKQFARIRLERGVDGTVTYDPLIRERDARGYWTYRPSGQKRTIPNHWAIAYTTNLKTGERFESMKVSVQTALAEGWLTKYQSKWQTITELMVGYRAEAFLIRQHFPESLFGLYLQDELEDIIASKEQQATVEVVQPSPSRVAGPAPSQPQIEAPKSDDPAVKLSQEMIAANTVEELRSVAEKVKTFTLPTQATDRLRTLYLQRKNEIVEAAKQAEKQAAVNEQPAEPVPQDVQEVEVEEVTEEPAAPVVEEVKKTTTTRKPRAKKTASEGGDFDANAVVARINAAKSEEELAVIREEIKNDEKIGRIAADLAEYFGQVIENRFVDFEDAEDEANETKRREMEANLYDLTREVRSQPDAAGLKAVVDKAAKWRDAGDIDLEMFRQVVDEAKKRSASFTSQS